VHSASYIIGKLYPQTLCSVLDPGNPSAYPRSAYYPQLPPAGPSIADFPRTSTADADLLFHGKTLHASLQRQISPHIASGILPRFSLRACGELPTCTIPVMSSVYPDFVRMHESWGLKSSLSMKRPRSRRRQLTALYPASGVRFPRNGGAGSGVLDSDTDGSESRRRDEKM